MIQKMVHPFVRISGASGAIINRWNDKGYHYYIITANHVVDKILDKNMVPIDLLQFNRNGKETNSTRVFGPVIEQNKDLDYAIVQIKSNLKYSYTINTLSPVSVFDKIYKVGAPNKENLVVSEGIVSGFSIKCPGCITSNVSIYHGDSGSPLYNSKFELIGINLKMSVGYKEQRLPHIGYSLPISKVYESLGKEKTIRYFK